MPPRTRLDPARRREQLLDLGAELLAEGRFEELSVEALAEAAGISRGLLYHYFDGKRGYQLAVLHRLADRLVAITAPQDGLSPLAQLTRSLDVYVDFVRANHAAYLAFKRGAGGGDEDFQRIYDQARAALTDRIFTSGDAATLAALGLVDTPSGRILVRGWSALVEDALLAWLADPRGVAQDDLVAMLARALPAVGAAVGPTR